MSIQSYSELSTNLPRSVQILLMPLDTCLESSLSVGRFGILLRSAANSPRSYLSVNKQINTPIFALSFSSVHPISANSLIGCTDEIPLEFGMLKARDIDRGENVIRYWYWRYYNQLGKRKDAYMGKDLDRALAKVRAIGIPEDAVPKRKNKGKKKWAV